MSDVLKQLEEVGRKTLYSARLSVSVGLGTCGIGSGAMEVYTAFLREKNAGSFDFELRSVGCFGFCSEEPLVMLSLLDAPLVVFSKVHQEDVPTIVAAMKSGTYWKEKALFKISSWDHHLSFHTYGTGFEELTEWNELPFFRAQKRWVLRNAGLIDPTSLAEYVAVGGYYSLQKALYAMDREQVLEQVKDSQLRGRGGAGFPTGLKWELMCKEPESRKFLLCNADEGDPGAYMNRNEMESDPHMLIEGMLIGAYATGAREGIIYVRAEYPLAVQRIKQAIEQAYHVGLLGENILQSNLCFNLSVVEGAGAFVCGEETALIASLEGKAGRPHVKPPFPAQKGYLGFPTTINNLETWCNIPLIIGKGSSWYRQTGLPSASGTKVFSLVGKVKRTGLVELPLGEKLTTLVYEAGGGAVSPNKKIKAVQSGGPSGGCIPARLFDHTIDYESLASLNAIMGSGGMVVMDTDNCMVDMARYFIEFTNKESCGACTPCREGLSQVLAILDRITKGEGREDDLSLLKELGEHISDTALCGLGQTACNPVLTTLSYFRDEYESHIRQKRCEAGTCEALVSELCSNSCPLSMRIPAYIALIKEHRLIDAYTSTLEDNPLPGTLGRICHFHCQMRCRREQIDIAVHQGLLHRYLADTIYQMGAEQEVWSSLRQRNLGDTAKSIALVGAGPANLCAAFYLRRLGHTVTVFDEHDKAGGVLRYGIPAYRLPRELLDKELEVFPALGIVFKFGMRLGRDVELSNLVKKHDAVILGLGAYHHREGSLPIEKGQGVVQGTEILRTLAEGRSLDIGSTVMILGGGNVAVDAARSLWRMGKQVTVVYRRSREDMPANLQEIEDAFQEGIQFLFDVAVERVIRTADNKVVGLVVQHLECGEYDLSGRRKRLPFGSTEILDCDAVVIAIGEQVDTELLHRLDLQTTDAGCIAIQPHCFETNFEKVYAIGDVVTGPSTAAEAMGQGKELARLLDRRLMHRDCFSLLFTSFSYDMTVGKPMYEGKAISGAKLPVEARNGNFSEVDGGLTGRQAQMEASRCLRCDVKNKEVLYG